MAFRLRNILALLLALICTLTLTAGCRPTYPKEHLIELLEQEIQDDWGITTDRIRIQDDYLGVIYREESLWDTDGKLRQEVALHVANIERTVERVLVSSDATINTFSVTVAGADAASNIRFERPLDAIRQKRKGETSWQDTFDADNNTALPSWTWEPFGEPYYYFAGVSADELAAYVQDQLLARYRLRSKIRIADGAASVVFRVPRLWEGNELLPDSEQLQYAVLSLLSTVALKSDLDITEVSVTMGANDSQENLTITDTIETLKSTVTGLLDQEGHKAALVRTRTPFWLWDTHGMVGWYSTDELTTRINEVFNRTLKWKPAIDLSSGRLTLTFRTSLDAPATLFTGETLTNFASALLSIYDAVLLSDQIIDRVVVSFTSNSTAQAVCWSTPIDEIKALKTDVVDTESYVVQLERDMHDTCEP